MSPDSNLSLLKKYVLLKSSIQGLIPSDCKRLSIIISKAVNKNISETTIKRFYGFAEIKHKFSKFTLTVLSEYVGRKSWEDFCEYVKDNPKQLMLGEWEELFYKAKSITQSTLNIIRNKSVIPYHYTINRKFAEKDFENFYNSDYSFISFVSQPGCGKSILLSHLAEIFFLNENAAHKQDIFWFINSSIINSSDYFDIEKWINEQLGKELNLVQYFKEDASRRKGKIIIVLDGFDDLAAKKGQQKNFLNQLSNFICSSVGNDWLKIVLSMRSTTWKSFYEHIRHSSYLKSKLFFGNHVEIEEFANVPPLSDKEINLILSRFPDIDTQHINCRLKALLKFPFYLQVYYQLMEKGKSFDYKSDLAFYEIISTFIHEKINLSQYYTEKILLLKKIIILTKQIKKGNIVYKENLLNDITVFKEAYQELILDGILIEEKLSDHVMPKEVVRFVHHHVYEYFLFIQIIDNNQRNINYDLFEYIRFEYNKSPFKLQLLEWAIRHAIINQSITPVIDALRLKLPAKEKISLMMFILQTLEYKSSGNSNTFNRIIDQKLHDAFSHELMQLDLLGPCYKDILMSLKRLTTQPNELMIYGSLLAYIAVLELDIKTLELEIRDLQIIEYVSEKWLFKPADCFGAIYSKLKNNGKSIKNIEIGIEEFINQPVPINKTEITVEQTLSYVVIFLVNFLCGNLENNIKVFRKIKSSHHNVFFRRNSLSVYMLNIYAINGLRIDSNFNPGRIINLLEKLQGVKRHDLSDYLDVLFLFVRAEHSYINKDYKEAMDFAEKCFEISDNNNISFLRVLLYILISNIYDKFEDFENVRNVRYKLHCLLEEKNINLKCFLPYNKRVKMLS